MEKYLKIKKNNKIFFKIIYLTILNNSKLNKETPYSYTLIFLYLKDLVVI